MGLAKQLYSALMAASYYSREEEAPQVLIDTMRNIALDLYPYWQEDESNLVTFARKYLDTCEFKEFKCWDEGYHTALYLMKIDDLCHDIVNRAEQLSNHMHGQQT